jgi:hypothetical protein
MRKFQRQVEIKIKHGMATGKLPVIERNSTGDREPKPGVDNAEGSGGQSK